MQLIDTNIFVEFLLGQKNAEKCEAYLEKVASGEQNAVITDFSIYSISLVLESHGKKPLEIREFMANLPAIKGLKIYPLSLFDQMLATQHIETFKLDFDDALILQAMKSNGITELVTLDKHFNKIKEIEIIRL